MKTYTIRTLRFSARTSDVSAAAASGIHPNFVSTRTCFGWFSFGVGNRGCCVSVCIINWFRAARGAGLARYGPVASARSDAGHVAMRCENKNNQVWLFWSFLYKVVLRPCFLPWVLFTLVLLDCLRSSVHLKRGELNCPFWSFENFDCRRHSVFADGIRFSSFSAGTAFVFFGYPHVLKLTCFYDGSYSKMRKDMPHCRGGSKHSLPISEG